MIKMSLLFMSLLFNIMFTVMKHPLSMGMIMLIQTMLMAMIMGTMSLTFWYSYIIFIIIIGALLILFIYMTSLIPNKKMKFSKNIMLISIMVLLINIYMIIFKENLMNMFINMYSTDMFMINENVINNNDDSLKSILYIYDEMSKSLTLFLMNYLLYVLIIIVSIINMEMGTLRILN